MSITVGLASVEPSGCVLRRRLTRHPCHACTWLAQHNNGMLSTYKPYPSAMMNDGHHQEVPARSMTSLVQRRGMATWKEQCLA
jgi:hypothetical protein